MTAKEMREAAEWAREKSREVTFQYPDRKPNEPPATEQQLEDIHTLVRSIDEAELAKLGRWQAAALLERMRFEREMFTQEMVEEYLKHGPSPARAKPAGDFRNGAIGVLVLVVVLLIMWLLGGS